MTQDDFGGRLLRVLRYGTADDERIFRGTFRHLYDSVIVSGTTIANSPSAIAVFLSSQAAGKPFVIDPRTHVFQHGSKALRSSKSNEIRESVRQLALMLGEPVSSALAGGRPVEPSDFSDSLVLDRFVQSVAGFQTSLISEELSSTGDMGYLEFAGRNMPTEPEALIAPYFSMDERTVDKWLPVNLEMAKRTKEQNLSRRVLLEVVVDVGLLDSPKFDALLRGIAETPVDGVALWVDGLDETQASSRVLSMYVRALATIGRTKPLTILYGSYLSVAMARLHPGWALRAVCYSLDYGESRSVTPVGGGIRSNRFYYPRMHARIRFEDAQELAQPYIGSAADYEMEVCGCPVCKALIREFGVEKAFGAFGETQLAEISRGDSVTRRPMQTLKAHRLSAAHYLFCKSSECTEQLGPADEVAKHLDDTYHWARSVIGDSKAGYLRRWRDVLTTWT